MARAIYPSVSKNKLTSLTPQSRPQCCGAKWPNITNYEEEKQAINNTTVTYYYYIIGEVDRKNRGTRVSSDLPKAPLTGTQDKAPGQRGSQGISGGSFGYKRDLRMRRGRRAAPPLLPWTNNRGADGSCGPRRASSGCSQLG
jgi:hypothetical protein